MSPPRSRLPASGYDAGGRSRVLGDIVAWTGMMIRLRSSSGCRFTAPRGSGAGVTATKRVVVVNIQRKSISKRSTRSVFSDRWGSRDVRTGMGR